MQAHERTSAFILVADEFLDAQGFTEHGFRHARMVGHIAFNVLTHLHFDPRTCELGAVAGYLHDIGNVSSRANHGQTSAILAYDLLKELDVPARDIAHVMGAVGNHEEQYGDSVSPISAAVILADKSDVHRSRVRKNASIEMDIHDRVNYSVDAELPARRPRRQDADAGAGHRRERDHGVRVLRDLHGPHDHVPAGRADTGLRLPDHRERRPGPVDGD